MFYRRYPFITIDELTKLLVWSKAIPVPGYNPALVRKDMCGNWMQYDKHGTETEYGWEIDHIFPSALGGSDDLDNLQPLWWQNNRRKSDTYPWYG